MIEVRRINKEEDYDDIKSWWENHGGETFLNKGYLPSIGFISYEGQDKIACCFAYKDSMAKAAFLAWVCVNPKANKKVRDEGIDKAIQECIRMCDSIGIHFVWTGTSNKFLQKRIENMKFETVGEEMKEYVKRVEGI